MTSFLESSYSMVHMDNAADQPSVQQFMQQLEKGSEESKQETMRMILTVMLNGDPLPQLLMHIIRFIMPSKNKALKKLLYFYYEICPKHDASGKLKQEMILVWYVLADRGSGTWGLKILATESGTICCIPTNTFVALPSASFAKSKMLSSSSPSSPPPASVSSTAMPTYAKTPFSPCRPYSSTQST